MLYFLSCLAASLAASSDLQSAFLTLLGDILWTWLWESGVPDCSLRPFSYSSELWLITGAHQAVVEASLQLAQHQGTAIEVSISLCVSPVAL